MKLLLKGVNALLAGEKDFKPVDIEVDNGIISQIGKIEPSNEHKVISNKGLHCSAGFFDSSVNFCEPGLEYKEDLISGTKAAAFGGFTQVAILPDTEPFIDNRPQVEFVKSATKELPVSVEVLPLFTKAQNDCELSEIGELADAGALAFTQKEFSVVSPSVLLKALEYAKVSKKKILVRCTDFNLIQGAFVHEGSVNVTIGMRGIPSFTEELLVKQHIELLRYSDSAMHISGVSCVESIALIAEAKKEGLKLTADTAIYNLIFTEEDIVDFDTNFKLNPPLRSVDDKNALIDAVKKGIIDTVTCNHAPQDIDQKKTEIEMAAFGVIGLQTAFSALVSVFGINEALNILITRSRAAFSLRVPELKVGSHADIALFVPDESWTFGKDNNQSKSENSMFFDKTLIGKPYGIIKGNALVLNE